MDKNQNIYTGIVTNVDDPDKKGRVQVYISALGPSLKCEQEGHGAKFRTIGSEYGSLSDYDLKVLDKQLVWCYTASPIIGGGSIGRYNRETGKATTSNYATDTNEFQIDGQNHGALSKGTKFAGFGSVKDAFSNPASHTMRNGNYHGTDYTANCYVNAPNGLFSKPALNAKVVVAFINGSKNNAIILGKVPWGIEDELINED